MSSDQYQRSVNSLDKDIADLEKKKAAADKKAADEQGKAARVRFSSNISMSSLKMRMNEKERHEKAARKASEESANLQKKIAEKRNKRNDAYLKLQRELQNEKKKEISAQQRVISNMQRSYEERIAESEKSNKSIVAFYNLLKLGAEEKRLDYLIMSLIGMQKTHNDKIFLCAKIGEILNILRPKRNIASV